MSNETQTSRFGIGKKVASFLLSATIIATSFTGLGVVTSNNQVDAANSYGLADNIQDGTILHCFTWKYTDIKAMLPEIAEAGFTSIQISPPQPTGGTGPWWWFYQPLGFYVGTSDLGTKNELQDLVNEAKKYNIKMIADIVANHLAGDHSRIQDDLKGSQYWHSENYDAKDDTSRYQVTHGKIGMPDLKTEDSYVQQCVKKYVEELKSMGFEGIRWDAAKHIGLPSEGDQFWPTVTSVPGLWNYGEILNNPGMTSEPYATNLLKEYAQYMTITDSKYGMTLRDAFKSGTVPSAFGNLCAKGIADNKLLYWGESHDTWSNNSDWGYSWEHSQNVIDRAYAVAASRNNITALYFSRPSTHVKDEIKIGQKGSTHFTSKEVAAVNHFHNAMIGQKDYYITGNNAAAVCREKGAVVVLGSGGNRDVTVPNGGSLVAPGTYTDEITGSKWTVTSSTISGHVGDTGIAVVYNPGPRPVGGTVSATPSDGTTFTDTLTVKLSATGVKNAKYTTSEGASGSYTDGQTITIGASTAIGSSVTLNLSGTKEDGSSVTATYKYTKKDPNAVTAVYFDNSSYNWSSVYAYIYKGDGESAVNVAEWPGTAMTKDSATGYYKIEIPEGFENGRIMFTENANATTNRYPADQQPGLEIGGSSMKFSAGNKWETYSPDPGPTPPVPTDPTVTSSKASGTSFTTETLDITLTLANATSGTYSVDDGPEKNFTGSKTVTIGEGKIGDSVVTVKTTAKGSDGTTKSYTFTYNKKYQIKTTNSSASLSSHYSINKTGKGKNKTITVDGDVSDWDSSMLIAQGAANDDPRVYRPNSMYEIPYDAYAMYAAWDDTNLYLMVEMTNVQDVVAPNDRYPLGSNATVDSIPMFIYIDTGKSDAIGNSGKTQQGGTLWNCHTTVENSFNRVIALASGVGKNGPYIYGGDSTGINEVELGNSTTSGIVYNTGKGILSSQVIGINGGYGEYNNRTLGDMCSDSADWVDFNTKNHNSANMDYNYEFSIPLSQLGITKSDIENNGIGVLFVHSSGASGMDCLPYDLTMNDSADQSDPKSNPENSFEKSDDDHITTSFARVGNGSSPVPPNPSTPLQVNFGTDKSAPQLTTTTLTLKAIGYGGTAPYKYQFYVDGNVVKPNSTTDSYSWQAGTVGKHTIKCVITDSKGATATVTKTFTAESNGIDPPVTPLKNNSSVSATSVNAGSTITITGSASGGKAPYQYKYEYRKTTSSYYTTIKSYSASTYASFIPSSAGSYKVKISVKDSTGKVVEKYFDITAKSNTPLTAKCSISATTINLGTTLTINAGATGGTAPYQYKIEYRKSTNSNYTVLKAYGTRTSATYTPTSTGTYKFKISIKDSTGKVVAKYYDVNVKSNAPLTAKCSISATTINLGTTLTINAGATGGKAPYQYKIEYKKSTSSSYTTLKPYSQSSSLAYQLTSTGTYKFKISIKDSTGKVVTKYYDVTVKGSSALTAKCSISATTINLGTALTIKGGATGGTAPYQYKFEYKKSSASSYTQLKPYSDTSSLAFVPTSKGSYKFKISIKDSAGKVVAKYYDVTVK